MNIFVQQKAYVNKQQMMDEITSLKDALEGLKESVREDLNPMDTKIEKKIQIGLFKCKWQTNNLLTFAKILL